MTTFWVYSGALSLLAAAFLLVPLMKRPAGDCASEAERKRQNVLIFKERLKELESELASGRLDDEAFAELKLELEQTLLDDASVREARDEGQVSAGRTGDSAINKGWFVLTVLLTLVSYALYFQWGAYKEQQQLEAMRFAPEELNKAKTAARQGDMNSLVDQLHQKLKDAPDNIEGWTLLARSAMNVENYALAVDSYQTVLDSLERRGESAAPVYGLLAQAQYFRDGGMSDAAGRSLGKALALDANEINAIGLEAIHAFDGGNFARAAELWERLLTIAPEHPARTSIEAGISRARNLAQLSSTEGAKMEVGVNSVATPVQSTGTESAPSIRVQVSLSEDLAALSEPDDILFIFARSETGPPMPLAASRHRVSELPLEVVLSDANAMSPMLTLSSAERVSVVARISKSGQPVAQPGDFQGSQDAVILAPGVAVSLTIDEVVQ